MKFPKMLGERKESNTSPNWLTNQDKEYLEILMVGPLSITKGG